LNWLWPYVMAMPGQDPHAVELVDVRRTYTRGEPVHALAGVTLSFPRGSYTAVMGPSGSGKSTLLNLVGCLDTATSGTVRIDGHDVTTLTERERAAVRGQSVGFVFQTFNLMPRLTALENVALPLVFQGIDRDDRLRRARDLLANVGLGDRLDHLPSELSGGQRQRVAIARALVTDPAIVLADEPTGNVDTETGDRIMGLLAEVHDAGNTILLVTHEEHVADRAERLVELRDGRVEADEPLRPEEAAGTPGGQEGEP